MPDEAVRVEGEREGGREEQGVRIEGSVYTCRCILQICMHILFYKCSEKTRYAVIHVHFRLGQEH